VFWAKGGEAVSDITLPRAVVWRLHAAFRDADKTIRPSGEKSDYSAEIAALDAALAEPDAIARAVEAEREACAKVCEERVGYWQRDDIRRDEDENCAAAIRARGSK
jgi:hypothetical protein